MTLPIFRTPDGQPLYDREPVTKADLPFIKISRNNYALFTDPVSRIRVDYADRVIAELESQ